MFSRLPFAYVLRVKLCICDTSKAKEKISGFRLTGLKMLGRVGTHIFFNYFFFWKKYTILCILKVILPFKMHKFCLSNA